jgi:hypothetical protein
MNNQDDAADRSGQQIPRQQGNAVTHLPASPRSAREKPGGKTGINKEGLSGRKHPSKVARKTAGKGNRRKS